MFNDPDGRQEKKGEYVVQKNDNVWNIAKNQLGEKATGKQVQALVNNIKQWNALNEKGDIDVGQTLFITNPHTANEQDRGSYEARGKTRTAGFLVRNLNIALEIGDVSSGSLNVSTVSARFAASIGLTESKSHEGSQVNAFRHVHWQATITTKFGEGIAIQAGNTHETNPSALRNIGNPQNIIFNNLPAADETIDLLNNVIGRSIGTANPTADQKELALKTLDYYRNYGLWQAVEQTDGRYKIAKTQLGKAQYAEARKSILSRNEYGFTAEQWKAREAAGERMIQRINAERNLEPKW